MQSEQGKLQQLLEQQEERLLQADKTDGKEAGESDDKKAEERLAERQAKIKTLSLQKRAAEVMLKIKEKTPAFKRVDFWWVDELVDHIEFGNHSLSERELMRQRALIEARKALLLQSTDSNDADHSNNDQSDSGLGEFAANSDDEPNKPSVSNSTDDNNNSLDIEMAEGTAEGAEEVPDDRTIRIFWKCGVVSTVSSGINTDEDAPRHLAEMNKKSRKNKKSNSKKNNGKKAKKAKKTDGNNGKKQ